MIRKCQNEMKGEGFITLRLQGEVITSRIAETFLTGKLEIRFVCYFSEVLKKQKYDIELIMLPKATLRGIKVLKGLGEWQRAFCLTQVATDEFSQRNIWYEAENIINQTLRRWTQHQNIHSKTQEYSITAKIASCVLLHG